MRYAAVIPTFNRARLLKCALESVLAQTLKPYQLIVVDDGSTDETSRLMRQYADRCDYLVRPHGGVSSARNAGIQHACCDWIAFLDSDDEWHPTKMSSQADLIAARPDIRLVHCDENWVRHGKPLAQKAYHRKIGGDLFAVSLERCMISPSAAVIHRAVFDSYGMFDPTLPACEDYDLWLRVSAFEEIGFVAQALVNKYGGHSDQLSRTTPALDRFRIRALSKLLGDERLSRDQCALVEAQLLHKLEIYAAGARKRGLENDARAAEHCVNRALGRAG